MTRKGGRGVVLDGVQGEDPEGQHMSVSDTADTVLLLRQQIM